MNSDEELAQFRNQIDMLEVAINRYGFVVDMKKTGPSNYSQQNNIVMKNARDEKLIMSNKNPWVYWNLDKRVGVDNKYGGDIISLVQWQEGDCNIGRARKILRSYVSGKPKPQPNNRAISRKTTEDKKDLSKIRNTLAKLQHADKSEYLESRGITPETLQNPLFRSRVLLGYNGAVIFPHWNEQGSCGFEIKGRGFSGFSKNGYKGLWYSQIPKHVEQLIFVESGIEALSHYQLFQPENTAYFTPSGNWKLSVNDLIHKVASKYSNAKVVAAFNNDKGGLRQSEELEKIVAPLKRAFIKSLPGTEGDDWNDELRKPKQPKKSNLGQSRKLTLATL